LSHSRYVRNSEDIVRCISAAVLFLLLCGVIASAENPQSLSFSLAGTSGKTQFRMGESIKLDLQFSSTTPGLYELHDPGDIFASHFTATPTDGVVDLAPHPGPGDGRGVGPPIPLSDKTAIIQRELNTWLAFRKPGHYRITAEYNGITVTGSGVSPRRNELIAVHSDALEIEIVDDPAWSQAELQKDIAAIEAPKTARFIARGGRSVSSTEPNGPISAHDLGLLDTRESAMAIVSIYSRNIDPQLWTYLDRGLRRSPYRAEVIAAMEKAIDAPDTPITGSFLDTLSGLMAMTNSNPPDFAKSALDVHEKLARALQKKQGEALTVSRQALAEHAVSVKPTANR
jgi:hypothetical protein